MSSMPTFSVDTVSRRYDCVIERGLLAKAADWLPAGAGRVFVVTERRVWELHCHRLAQALAGCSHEVLLFPGGEDNKRLSALEALAEEMARRGGDRSSVVLAFGGGVVNDVGGFLASIFMRGVSVLQVPTTLLAQVDAAIGGKTGVDLACGKNLVGSFHQPLAVLIDPEVLQTLPEREYRAGLFEVVKCGVIRSPELFRLMSERSADVLSREPGTVERIIAESVRIKADVVSADERESGLRAILNFGHTIGHALEVETGYTRFLHGEAVAFGMRAATHIALRTGRLADADARAILDAVGAYGPIPPLDGITAEALTARTLLDKKTLHGRVRFVLPERIGQVTVAAGIDDEVVRDAVRDALA
jgi:3-dehydroquinate synthase